MRFIVGAPGRAADDVKPACARKAGALNVRALKGGFRAARRGACTLAFPPLLG